jgi:ElaB/YqjD/DUF883 family membrane-anchored ribosome-binding protein
MSNYVGSIVDTTVARADNVKVKTADALEEAARKLREADLSARGDDVTAILNDVESRIDKLRADVGKKAEPVEDFIVDHPFASILIAAGVGFMVGTLVDRMRARD